MTMQAAKYPRARRDDVRLLIVDASSGAFSEKKAADLPNYLSVGDLLVVNDAATLPASLLGQDAQGQPIELRLCGPAEGERFSAVVFGAGDWRIPTEHRAPPKDLQLGARLILAADLSAQVTAISPLSPRLIEMEFNLHGAALWAALYRKGRPVQYSYLQDDLNLWSVQTVYGARPWAAEMPSAGRPLTWQTLLALRQKGIELCWITHAAGLSSTGDPVLDRALPLPERYDIPQTTVAAIARARRRQGRIIAVGTTVVRALEGAARNAQVAGAAPGTLTAGSARTDLLLDAHTRLQVVDALLSGLHGPKESHFRLLSAFAPAAFLSAAWEHAIQQGYLCHEFGDLCLLGPALLSASEQNQRPSILAARS